MPSRNPAPQRPALTELITIARSLLPQARRQAERGRPRLLAVCSRIILSARRIKLRADTTSGGGYSTIENTEDLDELT